MRIKLRYALPIGQMAMAVTLLWWSRRFGLHATRYCDSPGPDPAWILLSAINAPLLFPRQVWQHMLAYRFEYEVVWLLECAFYVAAVGLLWYGVAWDLDARRKLPVWRVLLDALLILYGVCCGVVAFAIVREVGPILYPGSGCYGMPTLDVIANMAAECFFPVWAIVLVIFLPRRTWRAAIAALRRGQLRRARTC